MENLKIIGINRTSEGYFIPHVEFDAESGQCEISGGSYLENTMEFYQELEDWIEEFIKTENRALVLNIKLQYFNTSSGKGLSGIFHLLRKKQDEGKNVRINWFYSEDDVDSLEEAEDFIISTRVKMNLIEVDDILS